AGLAQAEGTLTDVRRALDALGAEEHKLELERTEILGRKRGLAERVEAEWRKPLDQLLADAPVVAGDLAWLRQENERLQGAIDAVGPVNALAVEEHAEEMKRLEFLMTQRDDLVTARQSLQQAAREIDRTAKAMFLESFGKVRENFRSVFQTLFGGGECDVRLANEDEPLESEIEIHAAPRGKRTQRIHLLSSGERTLVARALRGARLLGLAVPAGVAARRLRVSPAAGITPLAPVDPALTTITPDFSWSLDNPPPPGTTVTYRLRVARDSAFASLVVDTATDTAGYTLRRPLKPGRPLFWRVDASSATTGVVGPLTVPSWAALTTLSAPGGVNTADDQPTFAWRSPAVAAPPGPFRYDLTGRGSAVH